MPVKYQPDLIYLRHVKTRHVHLFTLIQTVCFAFIMVVKEITVTSLAFPITVSAAAALGNNIPITTDISCMAIFFGISSYAAVSLLCPA